MFTNDTKIGLEPISVSLLSGIVYIDTAYLLVVSMYVSLITAIQCHIFNDAVMYYVVTVYRLIIIL